MLQEDINKRIPKINTLEEAGDGLVSILHKPNTNLTLTLTLDEAGDGLVSILPIPNLTLTPTLTLEEAGDGLVSILPFVKGPDSEMVPKLLVSRLPKEEVRLPVGRRRGGGS
jgi:hypothetical protein